MNNELPTDIFKSKPESKFLKKGRRNRKKTTGSQQQVDTQTNKSAATTNSNENDIDKLIDELVSELVSKNKDKESEVEITELNLGDIDVDGAIDSDTRNERLLLNLGDDFYSPDYNNTLLAIADNRAKNDKKPVVVMAFGPSGFGKTETAKRFAKATGRKFYKFMSSSIISPRDFFGEDILEVKEGSTQTTWVNSAFAEGISQSGSVILLDEINRISSRQLAPLMQILEGSEFIVNNKVFKCADDVVFFLTANVGYQYTGTYALDEALLNRTNIILDFGDIPEDIEIDVVSKQTGLDKINTKKVVRLVRFLREKAEEGIEVGDASIRVSVNQAINRKYGLSIKTIAQQITSRIEDISVRKDVLDTLLSEIGA